MNGDGSGREGTVSNTSNKGKEVAVSVLCAGTLEWLSTAGSWGDGGEQWKRGWELTFADPSSLEILVPAWHPVKDVPAVAQLVLTAIL